jgi:hypothetical protein
MQRRVAVAVARDVGQRMSEVVAAAPAGAAGAEAADGKAPKTGEGKSKACAVM